MSALTIEIEDVSFLHKSERKERWIDAINGLCNLLEGFLRTDDTIEQVRFVVLDKPGVAVKSLKRDSVAKRTSSLMKFAMAPRRSARPSRRPLKMSSVVDSTNHDVLGFFV